MPLGGQGKLPGKTIYSGRRRAVTRSSGFHAHAERTGRELQIAEVPTYKLSPGQSIQIQFRIPACKPGSFIGFGGWFNAPATATCTLSGDDIPSARTLTPGAGPNWSKFGSMWTGDGKKPTEAVFSICCARGGRIALWGCGCGVIEHKHLTEAREVLLTNMHEYSPEAHFFIEEGTTKIQVPSLTRSVREPVSTQLFLKSCNRCGRSLPINVRDERRQLSFTNHCVAEHKRPCQHTGFGRLKNVETGELVQLDYGFQLECRFCKKFEVNAAHNPQRTTAQMKEDAQRRRALEFLVSELNQGSLLLEYRHGAGTELADDVWKRFGGRCFNCGKAPKTSREMQLDHTRPLAMLWPIDGTATALCKTCNCAKRDRFPADFYTHGQLKRLGKLTGLTFSDLRDPSPNTEAVANLKGRLNWFFNDFVRKPELLKIRDGKTVAELLVKALQKTINRCPKSLRFDLVKDFERRRT